MSAIEATWNVASEMEFRVKQKLRITIINPFLLEPEEHFPVS